MDATTPVILQINDSITRRSCALRIQHQDSAFSLGMLMDKYLLHAPIDQLVQEGRTTARSADTLFAMQDMVYASANSGRLLDMFTGIVFSQKGQSVGLNDPPVLEAAVVGETEVSVIDLTIDRTNVGYHRNWRGFHQRRWQRRDGAYMAFVRSTLESQYNAGNADSILQLDTTERKLKFLKALARRVWDSDFENYSRFIGDKLIFKSGDETIRNIADGGGGICSEKVQALKFLTDHFGLESEYIIAGDNAQAPVPVDKLRELLTTFEFRFSKRYMRYWQHTALLYDIDGTLVLVDATNGNIPFLFLRDDAAERLLGYQDKTAVKVRMVEFEENFYYHRVPQDVPENLFFALEGWIPDADMMQVFDNELGLFLSSEFFVSPVPYVNEKEFFQFKEKYLNVCYRANLECSVNRQWDFDSPLGESFVMMEPGVSQKILLGKEHLLHRYNEWDGPGHESGLVIIRVRPQDRPYFPRTQV